MNTCAPKNHPAAKISLGAALVLTSWLASAQTVIFSETFATDTSGSWAVFSNAPDYTNQFAFAYTTNKYVRGGVTNTIPLAPSSASSAETNGLKLRVNDTDGAVVGVNLYPVGQTFSNDYALKFDMWLNYTGTGFGAGTGGTEDAHFGINHKGDKNVFSATGSTVASAVGDGVWFAVDADGDYSRDYQAFIGDNVAAPTELQGVGGGFLDRDGDAAPEVDCTAGQPATFPLKLMFPSPTYESAGMPSKQWVQVEVRQRTNDTGGYVTTWLIDGYVIAEHSEAGNPTYAQTNGNIMIGLMDPFASIGSPAQDSFLIYDNVRVVDLSGVATNEVVSIAATDGTAAEPSGDDGILTITRTGSTASPLSVNFRTAGTATRNVDYRIQTNGVTITNATAVIIPAGSASVDVAIQVLNDATGESTEQAMLVLAGSGTNSYDIRSSISAAVDIADDGDLPVVTVQAFRTSAYEGNTNRYAEFRILFSTPYSLGDVSVNYTISGSAVNGTHYESIASPSVMLANTSTNAILIIPIQNADTVSNRTVTLTLASGVNYVLSTNAALTNATVTIFNDDYPAGTGTLFSDNFDVDSSGSWNVNASSANCGANFAYDYGAGIAIPSAPHSTGGSTLGLRLRANSPILGAGAQSGISASPTGQGFTGDYRLRFDMWLSVPGSFPGGGAGSTQHGTAGVTPGTVAQWFASTVSSNWVLFGATGDGNNGTDYRVYCPTGGAAGAQVPIEVGVYAPGPTNSTGGISPQNNTHPYYSIFGPQGAPASQSGTYLSQSGLLAAGSMGQVWHDVVITKLGNTLLWDIDGVRIAAINTVERGTALSTNIFVGQSDINAGQTSVALDPFICNIVDNLVVEGLAAPTVPAITNIAIVNGTNVQVDFTGGSGDFPLLFSLMSSTNVTGNYAYTKATMTQLAAGAFRAVAPYTTNAARFYRILR